MQIEEAELMVSFKYELQ